MKEILLSILFFLLVLYRAGAQDTTRKAIKVVTVAGNRPLIGQKADRMVLQVAGSPAATGASAPEVLERASGVTVDR